MGDCGMVSPIEAYTQLTKQLTQQYPKITWNFEERINEEIAKCDAVKYWLVPTRKNEIPPVVFFIAMLECPGKGKIRKCIGIARPTKK